MMETDMMKTIVWDKSKCTGCRVCEGVCSLYRAGEFNPVKARGKVIRTVKDSILYKVRVTCQQCEEANCMAVCPVNAISEDERGVKVVDEEKCLGCRMCEMACPIGAISVDVDKKVSAKCDQCLDLPEPQCVKFCWTEALQYIPKEEVGTTVARAKSESLMDLPKRSKNDLFLELQEEKFQKMEGK
jgi:carbon-monoxide dehydrogenase iron sulfur subunit